jgi:hypothetical protein
MDKLVRNGWIHDEDGYGKLDAGGGIDNTKARQSAQQLQQAQQRSSTHSAYDLRYPSFENQFSEINRIIEDDDY